MRFVYCNCSEIRNQLLHLLVPYLIRVKLVAKFPSNFIYVEVRYKANHVTALLLVKLNYAAVWKFINLCPQRMTEVLRRILEIIVFVAVQLLVIRVLTALKTTTLNVVKTSRSQKPKTMKIWMFETQQYLTISFELLF